ncbi:gamma carbonic anhydrase family protein [Alphaproteobacteria bacterium GH1-50]|uniref:Gamma carbonic anhydrase family protein n=1 Tax=Kangsaoukella pontilimi TaxID=2691042 RepID=A0A7C9MBY9_9RHOB|nr:gamma carbonic anhydrase family protein [Kangsaoukella pontilimi]MXQ07171.1 gamma carbonic anhydrase family protein [Kangsaoukella pontilimi]
MTVYALGSARPVLPDTPLWIAPGARVMGDVLLEEDVSVWFGAVLRGDTERLTIRAGSNIQDGVVMHADEGFPVEIGRGCTIGHNAIIHGCTLGENTLVGMGATILNGAKIGRDCLIGAGALITEGKVVPDGSLVMGMPGKVVREMSAEAIAANRASSRGYIERARRYLADFRDISED